MSFLLLTALPLFVPSEFIIFGAANAIATEYSVLSFCFLLYIIGLLGIVFNRKNFLVTMMCAELMYLGVISSFALYGTLVQDASAQLYALTLLILAACESAIGLGLLIALYRFGRTVDFEAYQQLGG
jgi:NADH-quinone oxidoreductase subunit K